MEDQKINPSEGGEKEVEAEKTEEVKTAEQPPQKAEEQATPATQPAETKEAGKEVPEVLKKAEKQPAVTSDEKIWGLASYIPLVAILALVINPRSDYIKLHGRQGLLLFLISFFSIFVYIVPFIGYVIGIIIHFGIIAIGLFSMYQAFIGNWWKIPVLGDLAGLIPVEMFTKVTREAVMGPKAAEKDEEAALAEEVAKEEKGEVKGEEEQPAEEAPKEEPAEEVPAPAKEQPAAEKKPAEPAGETTEQPKEEDVQQELPITEEKTTEPAGETTEQPKTEGGGEETPK